MTRERKLDAMFAERVLGLDLSKECDGGFNEGSGADPWCDSCSWSGTWGDDMDHTIQPLRYTRSLDAAWEGAVKLGKPFELGHAFADYACFNTEHNVTIKGAHYCLKSDVMIQDRHPAECLVIACLRAVGVEEIP